MIQNLYSASGDKILLLSGGPESHHAKKNLFASNMKCRVIIRQPKIEAQIRNSPLNGETIIEESKPDFCVELQKKDGALWKTEETFSAAKLNLLFQKLRQYTPQNCIWSGH